MNKSPTKTNHFAIQAPTYWPDIAYFALMDAVSVFVVADTWPYRRQSAHNRARLRTPQGWQWISVPVQGGQHGKPFGEVTLVADPPWFPKHERAMAYNYRTTPYFEYYELELAPFFSTEFPHLAALNRETIRLLHRLLGLSTTLQFASELPEAPASLAEIAAHVPDHAYLTLPQTAAFDQNVLPEVQVLSVEEKPYRQNFEGFQSGMSVLDLLFNYGPEAVGKWREFVQPIIRLGL